MFLNCSEAVFLAAFFSALLSYFGDSVSGHEHCSHVFYDGPSDLPHPSYEGRKYDVGLGCVSYPDIRTSSS